MPTHLAARVLAALSGVTALGARIGIGLAHAAHPAPMAPTAAAVVMPAPTPAAPGASPASAVAVAAATGPSAKVAPEPLAARRVVLYGDSLAWQSQDFFTAALAAAGITQVTSRTFGGTAICDWIDRMRADAASLRPDVVVVEFSGNALTPCMRALDGSALTGAAYFEKYAHDAAEVLDMFAAQHALVFFAGAPISRGAERTNDPTTPTLHAIYASLAESSPYGRFTDAGASVLSDGRWTETKPCLPGEPCTGGRDTSGTPVNVVRAPDGAHFCPSAPAAVHGVTGACPVWASGAWRFGNAMAAPVIAELTTRQQ